MSYIWRFMYLDVLQPEDSFPTMMRKMIMAISAIVALAAVYGLIQKLMGKQGKANSTSVPCYISLIVTFWGAWIYVKCTHTAPTWMIALWANIVSLTILLSVLACPNFPWEFALFTLLIALEIMKTPLVNLIIPVTTLIVFAYNFSLGRMGPPYPLLTLPDGSDSTPGELVTPYIRGVVIVLIGMCALHLQTEEFTRTSLAATAANEMSLEVSQKLAVYDTDGARAVLVAYASREQVDGALMTCFGTIVTNLERYRRYLPNHVLDMEEEEQEEGSSNDDESTPKASAPATPLQPVVHQASDQSEEISANEVISFEAPPVASPRNRREVVASPRNRRGSPVSNVAGLVVESSVTFSMVHYNGADTAMTPFVDRVHAVAQETFGAVHSFIADTVYLTWNAGRRTAAFLSRLRENVGDPSVTVSGVAASGIGRYQMAGGALQAVLVRVAWFPLLRKLHTIAKTHGALLLDQKTNKTAKFHMKTQCVDCVGESIKGTS